MQQSQLPYATVVITAQVQDVLVVATAVLNSIGRRLLLPIFYTL